MKCLRVEQYLPMLDNDPNVPAIYSSNTLEKLEPVLAKQKWQIAFEHPPAVASQPKNKHRPNEKTDE